MDRRRKVALGVVFIDDVTGDGRHVAPVGRAPLDSIGGVDRIDFAEAYLVACAESTGVGRVVSFDRSTDRVDTVVRVEPT